MNDVEASEAHPLHAVLRDVTSELAATQQLLAKRLYHIAVLDECLVELNPLPMGFENRIKRLEDMFRSLREPKVYIDGYVVEFV
jgi:hypothetical protein